MYTKCYIGGNKRSDRLLALRYSNACEFRFVTTNAEGPHQTPKRSAIAIINFFTSCRLGDDAPPSTTTRLCDVLVGGVAAQRSRGDETAFGVPLRSALDLLGAYLRMTRFSSLTSRCCHGQSPAGFFMRSESAGGGGMVSMSWRRSTAVLSRSSKLLGPPKRVPFASTVPSSGLNMYSFSSRGDAMARLGRRPRQSSSSCGPEPSQRIVRSLCPARSSWRLRALQADGCGGGSLTESGAQKVIATNILAREVMIQGR